MKNSLTPIALFSLVASPLLFGGQDPGEAGGKSRDVGSKGAVQAADFVLGTLQNYSATGNTGAGWREIPPREAWVEEVVRDANGGAPPQVHVERIEVDLHDARKPGDSPHFRVALDLRIQAVDELVVAATMVEDFGEKLDEYNGELDVRIGSTRIDPTTKTIHVPNMEIDLPVRGVIGPARKLSRPLTEIIRRVSAEEGPLGSLRTTPSQRRLAGKRVERFLDIQLRGEGAPLTAASCGSFLHRLSEGEDAISVTRLSVAKIKGDGERAGEWKLEARLLIERDGE